MVKIKVVLDTSTLRTALTAVQKLVDFNIRKVLKQEAFPELINRIMIGYDSLAARADMLPEDPTNPSNWRAEFEISLREDLENNFFVAGNIIKVYLGDKDFLGYNASEEIAPDDREPLHWLVYYLEGLAGDWAFISPENYERLTGNSYRPDWGRFSQGFMLPRKEYYKRGFSKIIPFEEVRHPFSGYAPLDIFTEAVHEFRMAPYIKKAISAASRGQKL